MRLIGSIPSGDDYRLRGVGKTRLAWEVVSLTHTHFPDGICVAELAHITEASSLLSVISQAPIFH